MVMGSGRSKDGRSEMSCDPKFRSLFYVLLNICCSYIRLTEATLAMASIVTPISSSTRPWRMCFGEAQAEQLPPSCLRIIIPVLLMTWIHLLLPVRAPQETSGCSGRWMVSGCGGAAMCHTYCCFVPATIQQMVRREPMSGRSLSFWKRYIHDDFVYGFQKSFPHIQSHLKTVYRCLQYYLQSSTIIIWINCPNTGVISV